MPNLTSKLNSFKKTVAYGGELCYIDIEFSDSDVLISLMSIDTHLRKISAYGSDIESAVENFESKLNKENITL